jgi:MFS family permease
MSDCRLGPDGRTFLAVRPVQSLIRHEPSACRFLIAHAQSSLGNGIGYVSLLLLAYERLRSPWAIALVLLADWLPAMLLGPVLGALADRWSRRGCMIAGDVLRAVAFTGLVLVGGFAPMLGFALLAGVGSALFFPAALSALPDMVEREHVAPLTSTYGALSSIGQTVGPALAGVMVAIASPEAALLVNAATFVVSIVVLAGLRLRAPAGAGAQVETGGPLAVVRSLPGVPALVGSVGALALFMGMLNVAEPLLITRDLAGAAAAFGAFVAVFGLGDVAGSLSAAEGRGETAMRRRYMAGLALVGAGLLGLAAAPALWVAIGVGGIAGFGLGLANANQRLLLQHIVPAHARGRVFGLADAACAWGMAISLVAAGSLVALTGVRPVLAVAGTGVIVAATATALVFSARTRLDAAASTAHA